MLEIFHSIYKYVYIYIYIPQVSVIVHFSFGVQILLLTPVTTNFVFIELKLFTTQKKKCWIASEDSVGFEPTLFSYPIPNFSPMKRSIPLTKPARF